MDKKISVASFWLGIACVVMTVIFRGLAALGIWPILVPANGAGIRYITFHRAAEVFLMLPIVAGLMNRWHSKNFMTRFCASDCPYAQKCHRQRPIWKEAAPVAA